MAYTAEYDRPPPHVCGREQRACDRGACGGERKRERHGQNTNQEKSASRGVGATREAV